MKFFTCLSHAHPYEELYENSFFPQAACVTIAALIQYFLMAAFHWMLIEGIDLYFSVVKVYNINTKMYIYHVISWCKFIILQHALETVIMLSDRQIWCCHAVKCFDFPPFFVGRSSSDLGGHFTWHRYWKKKKGYKAILVINSGKKNSRVCSCSSPFNLLHLILCFVYIFKSVSFHLLKICLSFFSFTSSSLAADFPRLTTSSGYSSPM